MRGFRFGNSVAQAFLKGSCIRPRSTLYVFQSSSIPLGHIPDFKRTARWFRAQYPRRDEALGNTDSGYLSLVHRYCNNTYCDAGGSGRYSYDANR